MKPVLNAKDIKEYLGVSETKVYELFRQTDFPTLRIGGRRLVKSEDFLSWLEEQKQVKSPHD